MNKACIALGIIFFLSPFYGWIDVLPNFIGAIILIYGINKVSFLYEQFFKAKKSLWRLFWFSLLRFIFSLILPESFRMVIAFGFGVVELIYIIPALVNMFNGISYSKLRLGADICKKDITDTVKKLVLACVIVQYVLSVLPESITLLIGYDFNSINKTVVDAAETRRDLSVIFSFITGVIILIFICIITLYYLRRLTKSGEYKRLLNIKFNEEVALSSAVNESIYMKSVFMVFYMAIGFSVSFYNNRIECLPNVISAVFLLFLVFMLLGKSKMSLLIAFPVSVWGAFSVVSLIFQIGYFGEYSLSDAYWAYIYGRFGIYGEYIRLSVSEIIENLAAVAAIILVLYAFYKRIKKDAETFGDSFLCDKNFFVSLKLKITVVSVFGCISFVFKAVYRFVLFYLFEPGLAHDIERHFPDGYFAEYPLFINSVMSIVFIIVGVMTLSGIFDAVYKPNLKKVTFDG